MTFTIGSSQHNDECFTTTGKANVSLNRDRMTRLENRYELYIIDVEVQHGGYISIAEHLTAAQVIVWVRDPSSAHKW